MATLVVRSGSLAVRSRYRPNLRERLPRLDKLGVTGSSPVPPTNKGPGNRPFRFARRYVAGWWERQFGTFWKRGQPRRCRPEALRGRRTRSEPDATSARAGRQAPNVAPALEAWQGKAARYGGPFLFGDPPDTGTVPARSERSIAYLHTGKRKTRVAAGLRRARSRRQSRSPRSFARRFRSSLPARPRERSALVVGRGRAEPWRRAARQRL